MASKIQRAKKVIDGMSYQDVSAMKFGYPTEDEVERLLYDFDGESTEDSRTSVNGNWKSLKDTPMSDFDGGFDFADDEFDNFLTKKARARAKRRRELRKEGRAEGKSRKDARRDARRQAVEEVPKGKLFTKVARAIAVANLVVPRGAYLSLIKINYRGNAWKLAQIIAKPEYKDQKIALQKKWRKLGGRWKVLEKRIKQGSYKKPFFCGKKCKKKLLTADVKAYKFKKFVNFNNDSDYWNYDPVTIGGVAVGVWVGLAGTIIGAMASIISNIQVGKQQKRQIAHEKAQTDKELATLTQIEKSQIALAEKKIASESDPIKTIANNPNLSAQEKAEAIKLTREALGQDTTSKFKKYALIGGLALVGVVALYTLFKKK